MPLKNNLDLTVRSADGSFYVGNGIEYSSKGNKHIAVCPPPLIDQRYGATAIMPCMLARAPRLCPPTMLAALRCLRRACVQRASMSRGLGKPQHAHLCEYAGASKVGDVSAWH